MALGSSQSRDEPSGWAHCVRAPCPAMEWLLMLQSQESRDTQSLHLNGGSTGNTTARQCCRQREGHFVVKVVFFFLLGYVFSSKLHFFARLCGQCGQSQVGGI